MATIDGTSGNDSLTGTAKRDVLYGFDGNDLLDGLAGNDTLDGGTGRIGNWNIDFGADTLRGGDGDDTYIANSVADVVIEQAGAGTDTIIYTGLSVDRTGWSSAYLTVGVGIENVIVESSYADVHGNDLNNVITVRKAQGSEISGAGGNDTLLGGPGDDEFFFGRNHGNDVVNGRSENWELDGDQLRFAYDAGSVTVDFNRGIATSASGRVKFKNIESVFGTYDGDLLIANDKGVYFSAADGNDTLMGGGGNDLLVSDRDWNLFRDFAGNDWIVAGAGDDRLSSGGGDDRLRGGSGADSLVSGAGVDILRGGKGNDSLSLGFPDVSYTQQSEKFTFIALQDTIINGDAGTDSLNVAFHSMNLDLTMISNDRIRDIEVIDFSYEYGVNMLTLDKADILDISSSTDTLTILGYKGDKVNIVGDFKDLGVSDGFHRYKLGAGTLLVDTDITNVG